MKHQQWSPPRFQYRHGMISSVKERLRQYHGHQHPENTRTTAGKLQTVTSKKSD